MSRTWPFGIDFWIALFVQYSTKIKKIFLNHDDFIYNILISLELKICQNMSFRKKKLLNMSFYYLKTLVIVFY
jgi:hypothetical protein